MPESCKVESALEIFVGKWKPVILFHLFTNGTMRFSELQKAMPDITKKMLTSQLRELEYHNIVHREIYRQIPPKVEYSITEYGKKLTPLIKALGEWGMAHVQHLKELYGEERSVDAFEGKEEISGA
ncbi:helix-turn-helix transcriptional regulator [Paenibacillus sp. N4]|uniref:winged helix-turn-helix transcriptional regulator n=1 Tax=Paenibacillus vietnamensis TaxID=2590547 RepID=UPI001CD15D51|nr:helix-turn-helix domain-containing protein [Paenibacillus vietnamensis]MCA0754212.1 helix-turn-helix transcriptional regulator [Paenibacillus vietnamensis]